ncbi:hypothetical protein M1L60_04145 [Actinoplanes sp. TRM 88003]|uniref:Uncharacterized protein n=1 Tax=Paractinoplanes aksuensis TaxID=2939490 RepID=A0ABT1DG44_9ACTN|nr:hypothetical protein [Actinoplanes aksuensis]MCO8269782.1 hypothetical protein [Actinoplanes aksuensis]
MTPPELPARVAGHLQPGESLTAAIWVSRPTAPVSGSEMSPWRLRRKAPEAPRGLNGRPQSRAVTLDDHIRTVNDPRVLARTDRRLLLLARGTGSWRDLLPRRGSGEAPLHLRWECPAADLAKTTEQAGRLLLTFTDGSSITVLTPAAAVRPFLQA